MVPEPAAFLSAACTAAGSESMRLLLDLNDVAVLVDQDVFAMALTISAAS